MSNGKEEMENKENEYKKSNVKPPECHSNRTEKNNEVKLLRRGRKKMTRILYQHCLH